jgi:hypothetical protein
VRFYHLRLFQAIGGLELPAQVLGKVVVTIPKIRVTFHDLMLHPPFKRTIDISNPFDTI